MIVFSDLDGTLLDHETYRFDAALPALDALKERGVPLVAVTSKTAAEVAPILAALGLDTPAIVENGGGVFDGSDEGGDGPEPDDYRAVLEAIDSLPGALRERFTGFADMDATGIAMATGLDPDAARLAAWRKFTEPGLFTGTQAERAAFLAEIEARGLRAVQGGRFLTISRGHTKADRMAQIRSDLEGRLSRRLFPVIALGDAENDRPMLETADIAVVVANPAHPPLAALRGEETGRVIRTLAPGPAAWNAVVLTLLEAFAGRAQAGSGG